MNYNAKEGTIKFKDCSMDYLVFGKGYTPLVLIQGLNIARLKRGKWTQPVRYKLYAERFRVYMVDRRDPLPENITVEEIADDVANAIKALGVHKAYVMGNSQGGMIAQYFALKHPEMVEKLVLNVTTATTDDPVLTENVRHWSELAGRGDLDTISNEMMDMLYPPGKAPKTGWLMKKLYALRDNRPANEFKTLTEACLTCDTIDRLHEIKCPVLVMGGKQDKVISCQSSLKIAEALGTEAYLFDDLGHAAYETKEYQERVIKFLNE